MALKIRLRQQGRKNLQTFRLVVADVRYPRDGKYVEALGWYNPNQSTPEKTLFMQPDRIQYWLDQGAELTEKAASLVAKTAPDVLKQYQAKQHAHRMKMIQKRKG